MARPRLLLADDSLTIQRVVNLTFADEGIDVVTVGDGDSALREMASVQPDIVLADVHMPGPSGYEICSLLRGIEETAKIPVILLVGSFEQFDPEEADRVGANAFVTKPFQSIRQLVDQVKELISTNESEKVEVRAEESSPAAVPAEIDTTDIDSLYHQSFAETVELPSGMAAEMAAAAIASDWLDDEMIETNYTAGQQNEGVDRGQAASDNPLFSEVSEEPADHFAENVQAEAAGSEESVPSYEETLQMDAPPQIFGKLATDPSMHTAPTEELRRDPFATTTDAFDLDELDLLDLTTSKVNEQFSFGTPGQAHEHGSDKQVVSLSPELIDMIVKEVVEKLSEKY